MMRTSRDEDFVTKQEGNTVDGKNSKASSRPAPWSRLKDPRIVRVSRAFGGKDRHSKVCTVKGLRDRRVRLSLPTSIQLYDLQDRLGLNQPSKVVDWLLNATKHEIDKLPPLQMPPGNFGQDHHQFLTNHGVGASQSNKERLKINNSLDWDDPLGLHRSNYWNSDASLRDKSKEVAEETADEKENWNLRIEEEKQSSPEGHAANVSPNYNFFPKPNYSSIPGLLNNVVPYNSFHRWDPSSFSLSHIGSHGYTPQTEDLQNFNFVPLPSTLSLPSGSQVLVCPPGTAQSYFPSHVATSVEFDSKQINHFQMLSSSSQNPLSNSLTPTLYSRGQSMRPLHLSMASRLLPSPDCSGGQSKNSNEFPPK